MSGGVWGCRSADGQQVRMLIDSDVYRWFSRHWLLFFALVIAASAVPVAGLACENIRLSTPGYCSGDAVSGWAVSAHTNSANPAAVGRGSTSGWQVSGVTSEISVQQNAASDNSAWQLTGGAEIAGQAAGRATFQSPSN